MTELVMGFCEKDDIFCLKFIVQDKVIEIKLKSVRIIFKNMTKINSVYVIHAFRLH